MKKEEKKDVWKDWRVWIIILLAILFFSSFADNEDYEGCINECLYENEFCSNDFQVYSGDSWWMLRAVYDECHYDLRDCVEECYR